MSLEDAADNCRPVGFYTRSRPLCSALSTKDILFEVLFTEFQTGRNAVQNDSDEFPVGFPEDAYSEFSAEGIHIIEVYFFNVLFSLFITTFVFIGRLPEEDKALIINRFLILRAALEGARSRSKRLKTNKLAFSHQ